MRRPDPVRRSTRQPAKRRPLLRTFWIYVRFVNLKSSGTAGDTIWGRTAGDLGQSDKRSTHGQAQGKWRHNV